MILISTPGMSQQSRGVTERNRTRTGGIGRTRPMPEKEIQMTKKRDLFLEYFLDKKWPV
jgi:hypothetical protein